MMAPIKSNTQIPIIGFCAHSGTGKTTLLKKIIPLLTRKGIRIGVIKHAHHNFDVDKEGKDSYELRKAGAKRMLVSSGRRWALVHELIDEDEATFSELIEEVSEPSIDLILVEGFKHEGFDKIELHRSMCGKPPLYPDDPHVIALATDDKTQRSDKIPILDLNDADSLCAFIIKHCKITQDR